MTDKIGAKEIGIAVDWWTNQLDSTNFDNGDATSSMLASLVMATRPKRTTEQKELFAKTLTETLTLAAFEGESQVRLHVDYSPSELLVPACLAADIGTSDGVLPCKTSMWIEPGKIQVAEGYRAPVVTIYQEEETENG